MRNYFIRYNPKDRINYLYIFMLYGIAQYDKSTRTFNNISFTTKKELAEMLAAEYKENSLSYSTLTRLINNPDYKDYFTVEDKKILLNNNFTKSSQNRGQPFIIITNKEADFLIQNNDNLLAKYYLYIKYYCGLSSTIGAKQNFTAKQFLQTIGLSTSNHNNLSKVSAYNTLLSQQGYINIEKYRDKNGNERNIYTIIPVVQ